MASCRGSLATIFESTISLAIGLAKFRFKSLTIILITAAWLLLASIPISAAQDLWIVPWDSAPIGCLGISGKPNKPIVTITVLDAEIYGLTETEVAEEFARQIRQGLLQAAAERQPTAQRSRL